MELLNAHLLVSLQIYIKTHFYITMKFFTLQCTYVFGDSSNDLTMFRCGAHTIALGKHDEILDPYTEYVTDTVERDGVAKAMEHYGLI